MQTLTARPRSRPPPDRTAPTGTGSAGVGSPDADLGRPTGVAVTTHYGVKSTNIEHYNTQAHFLQNREETRTYINRYNYIYIYIYIYSCECALFSEAIHVVENISEILLNCVRTDSSDKLNKFTVLNRFCAVCACAANGSRAERFSARLWWVALRNEAQFNRISGRWTF